MAMAKMPVSYIIYCILGFAYVSYRHKANIQRMLNGTEPRIGKESANLTRLPNEAQKAPTQLIEPKNNA
jgi:glycerol-3-phosphate acyltransferase PlsY